MCRSCVTGAARRIISLSSTASGPYFKRSALWRRRATTNTRAWFNYIKRWAAAGSNIKCPDTDSVHQIGAALLLITLTLWLQCGGIAVLVTWARRAVAGDIHKLTPLRTAGLVVRFTTALIVLHGLEVVLWACCYRWLCFRSWESALYFSAVSYSTVGYGDIVLPSKWRMLGPLEGLIGVLMCGLSVSILFAISTRLVGRKE